MKKILKKLFRRRKYYWISYFGINDFGNFLGSTVSGTPYSLLLKYCEERELDYETIALINFKRLTRREFEKVDRDLSLTKGNRASDD